MRYVIKRNGEKIDFDKTKIEKAILNAFREVGEEKSEEANRIATQIADEIASLSDTMTVEQIQEKVIFALMGTNRKDIALRYAEYRYQRNLIRESNTTDKNMLEILEGQSEYWNSENSNKNPILSTTVRDYMAGETSKDLTKRFFLPKEITEAHEKGLIQFHDADYYSQHMHNCCLNNIEDMLQNGTVISEVMIESPHSFSTACNITTQVIAQVASFQYGGQSVSLAHLAPFVDVSRKKIREQVIEERKENGDDLDTEKIENTVSRRLKREITKGIQMIQYQVVTLMTTNGCLEHGCCKIA
jgi:ribonucleoside-triphosphate reductase